MMEVQRPSGVISWFAANPVAANLLMLIVIALGLFSFKELRKEAFPPLEPDSITVSVAYDSGDAERAEEGISIKIEEALESVAGIKRITSTSNAAGSEVTIEKSSDYDLDKLLTDVKNKVDSIYNFPVDAEKPVIEKERFKEHALWVQIYGAADRSTLYRLAERLKADLYAQSGISELSLQGKAEAMISIEVDEARLQSYGLSLEQIAEAINQESSTFLTTSLRHSDKVIRLKVAEQAYLAGEFAQIPLIKTTHGSLIRLEEVATVMESYEDDPQVLSRYNGQNAVAIELYSDEYGDITQIVEQAHEVIEQWKRRGVLPEQVYLASWDDQSFLIIDRLSLLTSNALTGIALVFAILALFLNLRVAFWVAAGLPFVFFGSLYFMTDQYMGLTINEMTTFGFILALGIVVDDAVVIGESIYSTRRQHGDTLASTIQGTLNVATPTLFGVLTTVAAFVSLANLSGMMGHVYSQFAAIITICLLLSMVESKLILPSHLAHLNTHRKIGPWWRNPWQFIQSGCDYALQWFNQHIYRHLIKLALRFRYAVILFFVALLILVMGMPSTGAVRMVFFPDIPGSVISAQLTMQNDASYGQTRDNLDELEALAKQADHLLMEKNTQSGSNIASLQLLSEQDFTGKVVVELKSDQIYNSVEFEKQWQLLTGQLEGSKKVKFISSFEMLDNFKVELKSLNEGTVVAAGKRFREQLLQTAGVSGIDDNLNPGQAQLRFQLTQQGYAMGMDTATLARQILQMFGGEIVQRYQRNQDEVTVRIRYPEKARQTSADIHSAWVRTPAGTVVPLTSVARIVSDYQVDEVTRIDAQRAVYLTAVVDKSVIAPQKLVEHLQKELVAELLIQYPDLNIHFAGEAEEQRETTDSMLQMFIVALLSIYVLLAIPLKSYVQPLLILTAIPFGVVGAILGHWYNDIAMSVLSLNGILALSGVVVNDSLLLVSRFNQLKKSKTFEKTGSEDIEDDEDSEIWGDTEDKKDTSKLSISANPKVVETIVETCMGRLRAVLLTSITTFAGLAPLLGETSMQAQFLIPAAASLGYGILFATGITLLLVPCLLMIQHDFLSLPELFRSGVKKMPIPQSGVSQ